MNQEEMEQAAKTDAEHLEIQSPAFLNDGAMPVRYTGFGEDLSPELRVCGLSGAVRSLAVVMDDLDVPFLGELNHWLIWNIPCTNIIPEGLPAGSHLSSPICAFQGIGYGKHKYRGPKQPPFIRGEHRYRFTVFALDCMLDLPVTSRKKDLLRAMESHVLQTGTLTGRYQPEKN